MFTIKTANTESIPANPTGQGINWAQISLGTFVLLIGTLVYVLDRPAEYTYFISHSSLNLSLPESFSGLFGSLGTYLPSFIHSFSFILITAGLVATHKNSQTIICLLWIVIDLLFEFGQGLIDSSIAIPSWFAGIPYLENTQNFFVNGIFDWNDVAATVIGAIAAFLVLRATTKIGRGAS